MGEVATLVKFGSHEHIMQLQQTGLLYMNNLPYFWKIEDKELRGDRYDGVDNDPRGAAGRIRTTDGKESVIGNWTLESLIQPEHKNKHFLHVRGVRPQERFPSTNRTSDSGTTRS